MASFLCTYMLMSPLLSFGDWVTILRQVPGSRTGARVIVVLCGVALIVYLIRSAARWLEPLLPQGSREDRLGAARGIVSEGHARRDHRRQRLGSAWPAWAQESPPESSGCTGTVSPAPGESRIASKSGLASGLATGPTTGPATLDRDLQFGSSMAWSVSATIAALIWVLLFGTRDQPLDAGSGMERHWPGRRSRTSL